MTPCFLTPCPKIVLVYIYPLDGQQGFAPRAAEMVASYVQNPPGMEHDTVVVCNGTPAAQSSKDLFNEMPNVTFLDHDNSGWDIGAYQKAAKTVPCDLMVFFAVHTYFRKPGWLLRMYEAFLQHGDTLYGATGNQGDLNVNVHPHIRTTAFWCSPDLMNEYPWPVTQGGGGGPRYAFEHGASCLTNFVKQQGKTPWVVGWNHMAPVDTCDSIPGGFHKGLQEDVLVGDRLTGGAYYPNP